MLFLCIVLHAVCITQAFPVPFFNTYLKFVNGILACVFGECEYKYHHIDKICNYFLCSVQFSTVQSLSRVRLFATPWIAARQASLSITNSRSLLKLMSIKSVMPSNHLILCRPLLLLAPIPPSIRGLFQWVNSSHEVAKVLEFQLQHQSFQWTPRTDLL